MESIQGKFLSRGITWMIAWLTVAVLAPLGLNAAPAGILVQGKLADGGGKPLSGDRAYQVQFYDSETGGAALGTAITGTVAVTSAGRFVIEVTPPAEALAANSPYYELAIDSATPPDGAIGAGDVFPSRVRVTSVMFAQKLAREGAGSGLDADMLDNRHAAEFATTTGLAAGLAGKADAAHLHNLQNLGGAVTDAQVPDDVTVQHAANADNSTTAIFANAAGTALLADFATTASYATSAGAAAYAPFAGTAAYAAASRNAERLGELLPTDFATTQDLASSLAGKADTVHSHDLQNLGGAVTDAQVPDNITVLRAAQADTATTAAFADAAQTARFADTATSAIFADIAGATTDADFATTAAFAFTADVTRNADWATTASYADVADRAALADFATQAGAAGNADTAAFADRATTAAYADNAGAALYAEAARNAERLAGLLDTDFVTSQIFDTALAGKADLVHAHDLQDMAGAVTDAQVPNDITVDHATNADSATNAVNAANAANATRLGGFLDTDFVTTAVHAADLAGKADLVHAHNLQDMAGAVTDAQVPNDITVDHATNADSATNAERLGGFLDTDFVTTAVHAADLAGKADAIHAHNLQDLSGAITDAQVPDDITVNLAANATTATNAANAASADDAARLGGLFATDFVTTKTFTDGMAGKASTAHLHNLQTLSGMVTDAQVPDNITINMASNAMNAMNATTAANATRLGGLLAADVTTTKTFTDGMAQKAGVAHTHSLQALDGAVTDAQVPDSITVNLAANAADAIRLGGLLATDYVTTKTFDDGIAGKADAAHLHNLQALGGAVTDAQVPDDITVNLAANATNAADAARLGSLLATDYVTTKTFDDGIAGKADAAHAHNLQALAGAVTDAQVPDDITVNLAATATNANNAVYATNANNAIRLGNLLATDYVTTKTFDDGMTGKANTAHAHNLQDLGGAVTDAQVPDDITVTERDTLQTVTDRGAATTQALQITNATAAVSPITGALTVAGGAGVGGALHVSNSIYTQGQKVFTWHSTADDIQSQPNCGYVLGETTKILTVTLPATPAVGDVVRVNGIGAGGWQIGQNPGQRIRISDLKIITGYMEMTRLSSRTWSAAATSWDGKRMVACDGSGNVFYTSDSGATWSTVVVSGAGMALASSAEGGRVAMGGYGAVAVSTDGGATWNAKTPPGTSGNYSGIAVDSAGAKVFVCNRDGYIHSSSNFGDTWTTRAAARAWTGIAVSGPGFQLAACASGDYIYTSPNSGATWTAKGDSRNWTAIAASADARILAATVNDDQIYMSYDYGETWVPRSVVRSWKSIAMSPDGTKLIAGSASLNAGAYFSTDSGVTWKSIVSGGSNAYQCLAISANGEQVVIGLFGGYFSRHISYPTRAYTPGGTSYHLGGGPCSAIELQYVGNDLFVPISYVGALGYDM